MFNMFSSSSSESEAVVRKKRSKNKTVTIVYADAPRLGDSPLESSVEETTPSDITLSTPSSIVSGQSVLDRLDQEKEVNMFFGYYPTWREMSLSDGIKLTTLEYFWNNWIFHLFNFLITHLLAQSPEDPVDFLVSLIDRCIRYRDEDGEPPLVFEDDHIRSVYAALDPMDEGAIYYRQYLTGMQTLGLTDFNILPDDIEDNRCVAKDVFLREAKHALLNQLDDILGKWRDMSYVGSEEFNVIDYDLVSGNDQVRMSRDRRS